MGLWGKHFIYYIISIFYVINISQFRFLSINSILFVLITECVKDRILQLVGTTRVSRIENRDTIYMNILNYLRSLFKITSNN